MLRDGGTAHVRPIRPERRRRAPGLPRAPVRAVDVLPVLRPARAAARDGPAPVHARRPPGPGRAGRARRGAGRRRSASSPSPATTGPAPDEAEVAFNVSDDHHGRGLGSVLLEHLAAAARERGIRRFTAEVLPQNGQMLAVFREAGYEVRQHLDDGVVAVAFDIDPTERSLAVMADREHRAEALSVRGLLTPRSVLVVADPGAAAAASSRPACGTSRDAAASAVRPTGPEVHGVGVGATAGDRARRAPGGTPSPTCPVRWSCSCSPCPPRGAAPVARGCARLRPHAVLVLSGGFAETGAEGLAHQRELLRAAHGAGHAGARPRPPTGSVRRGSAGTRPSTPRSPSTLPPPGRLALFCQSAPLAVGLLASARRRGLGLSTFVSVGQPGRRVRQRRHAVLRARTPRPTWSASTWSPSATRASSPGWPGGSRRRSRWSCSPPGRSGHVVPAGHAVRRTRVPRRALDEVLRQSGVIRVDEPAPAARRRPAARAPAAARRAPGRGAAGLGAAGRARRRGRRVRRADGGRPAGDPHRGGTSADDLAAARGGARRRVRRPGRCDAVVVVHVPTLGDPDPRIARRWRGCRGDGADRRSRASWACQRDHTGADGTADPTGGPTVPAYATPGGRRRRARRGGAVRRVARPPTTAGRSPRRAWTGPRARRAGRRDALRRDAAGRRPDPVALDRRRPPSCSRCYGIERLAQRAWSPTPTRRSAAAERLGWPVALKSTAPRLRHRIDLGGVRLDLPGPGALAEAMAQMRARRARRMADPAFEVQRDGADRRAPASSVGRGPPLRARGVLRAGRGRRRPAGRHQPRGRAAHRRRRAEMVRSVRAAPRLFGYRGLPAARRRGARGRRSAGWRCWPTTCPSCSSARAAPGRGGPSGVPRCSPPASSWPRPAGWTPGGGCCRAEGGVRAWRAERRAADGRMAGCRTDDRPAREPAPSPGTTPTSSATSWTSPSPGRRSWPTSCTRRPRSTRAEVRRHVTVLVLTPTRLVLAHVDDHPADSENPSASASATTESVPLRTVTRWRSRTSCRPGAAPPRRRARGADPRPRLGRRAARRPRAGDVRRPGVRRGPRVHRHHHARRRRGAGLGPGRGARGGAAALAFARALSPATARSAVTAVAA